MRHLRHANDGRRKLQHQENEKHRSSDCDRQTATLQKALCSLGKSKKLDGSGIAISGEFCHVRSELVFADWLPSIAVLADSVKGQNVPATSSEPFTHIRVLRDLTTINVESI
jgi:hypothetical protein